MGTAKKLKLPEFIDFLSQKKIPVASLLKIKYQLQNEFNIKIRNVNTEFIEFEECEHEESTDERFKNLKNVIVSLNERIAELEAEVRKLKNQ